MLQRHLGQLQSVGYEIASLDSLAIVPQMSRPRESENEQESVTMPQGKSTVSSRRPRFEIQRKQPD
jgi:hypothetical protein